MKRKPKLDKDTLGTALRNALPAIAFGDEQSIDALLRKLDK